jgi:hypothetical protein
MADLVVRELGNTGDSEVAFTAITATGDKPAALCEFGRAKIFVEAQTAIESEEKFVHKVATSTVIKFGTDETHTETIYPSDFCGDASLGNAVQIYSDVGRGTKRIDHNTGEQWNVPGYAKLCSGMRVKAKPYGIVGEAVFVGVVRFPAKTKGCKNYAIVLLLADDGRVPTQGSSYFLVQLDAITEIIDNGKRETNMDDDMMLCFEDPEAFVKKHGGIKIAPLARILEGGRRSTVATDADKNNTSPDAATDKDTTRRTDSCQHRILDTHRKDSFRCRIRDMLSTDSPRPRIRDMRNRRMRSLRILGTHRRSRPCTPQHRRGTCRLLDRHYVP